MNIPSFITVFVGVLSIIAGVIIANEWDRRINLRRDRLKEKRIVIFEKNNN